MKPILVIATNTFREVIRDRILYGILVFALLLVGLSLVLGGLSFTEHARISANFGFAGIQLSASILAIFVGSTLVAREIEKQTILTLLARPLTRSQFIVGKFLGLVLVILTMMAGLAVVVGGLISFLGLAVGPSFFVALYGIVLEALLLVAITILFGSFSRPIMTVIFASATFMIGHWIGNLESMSKTNFATETIKVIAAIAVKILPDLERFNWRSAPVYGIDVPLATVANETIYAFAWLVIILTGTAVVFRRRDFV